MQLLIRPKGFRLTSSLREFVVLRLRYALDRFQGVVDSVIVRLRDENGPRGGVDKACQFEVRVRGMRPLIIEERRHDLYTAIGGGAQRVERQVVRAVSRRRQRLSR